MMRWLNRVQQDLNRADSLTIKTPKAIIVPHRIIRSSEVGTLAVDGWAVTFDTASEGPGRAAAPPSPLLAVSNVTLTAHSVITVMLYDGPLLCGLNVAIKGLRCSIITGR